MQIHITSIYNQLGTQGIAQHKIAKVAKEMGFHELGLFRYDVNSDSDRELRTRIDGIISSIQPGDVVFLQSPSWNGLRYDLCLVRRIRVFDNVKIVFFVHDVIPLSFNSGEDKLRATIEIYNYADMIIVPSKAMLNLLRQYGLTVKQQMIQELWDYPISFELSQPEFHKRMFFTGSPDRFPFLRNWTYPTQLVLYSNVPFSTEGLNIEFHGYQKELALLSDLSKGGYGLVWPSDEANTYYQLIQPYKIGSYLAAGIPIIMPRGLEPEQVILENGLGFVVDSLEEANAIIQSTGKEEYYRMVQRIKEFNVLVKDGWFTKKMLTDSVMRLYNKNYTH